MSANPHANGGMLLIATHAAGETLQGGDDADLILGFSGAGKTTLVSAIAGLIEPDEGSIELRGERIERWGIVGISMGAHVCLVAAMRDFLNTVDFAGTIVIGEGEKDEAPMLANGEEVGNGHGPECDIAVDPVDGTSVTAAGRAHAISVIAVSDKGSMYNPKDVFYMDKLITTKAGKGVVSLDLSPAENVRELAKALKKNVSEITVAMISGTIISLLVLAYHTIMYGQFQVGLAISISIIVVILFAATLGTLVPLFLHKKKIDPAIATGPFITTTNDVFGIILYFTIAKLILGV